MRGFLSASHDGLPMPGRNARSGSNTESTLLSTHSITTHCGIAAVRHAAGIHSHLCFLRCLLFNGFCPSVRLWDEEAILACAASVDLIPIRAGLVPILEQSPFTSAKRRIQSLEQETQVSPSPVQIDQVYSIDESLVFVLSPVASGYGGNERMHQVRRNAQCGHHRSA